MTDTIDAGDLIAPLGEVLNLLDGKISIADADALVAAFSKERISEVKPGDLITSRFFNQLIVDLRELRRRVTLLEGTTSAPRLDSIDPSPVVRVGMLVTLSGVGFDPLSATERPVAHFGDVEISDFILGSRPGVLKLIVPDRFGALPRNVNVRVSSGTRFSNALPITIRAPDALPQGGETIIRFTGLVNDPPGKIAAGSKLTYSWQAICRTVRPDGYKFSINLTNVEGASEEKWLAGLTLEPASAQLANGDTLKVVASLIVPDEAVGVRLALAVEANPLITLTLPNVEDIVVGQPPDVSDARAPVGFDSTSGTFDQVEPIAFEGQVLQGLKVSRGGSTDIVLLLEPKDTAAGSGAGPYRYEAMVEGNPPGWAVKVSPITSANVAAGATRDLTVSIFNSEAAGASTTRLVRVWARHLKAAGGDSDFAGFHRFPVQTKG